MRSSVRTTSVVAIGLAVVAAVCCVWAWMAYSYLLGSKVTIQPGDDCLEALQTTTGQVTCTDAMWLTGTKVNQGKLIDYRQTGGEFEYDEIPARLVGSTARTKPPVAQYLAGLAGPPLLAAGVVLFVVAGVPRRFSRPRVPEYQTHR